ncbi:phage tail protein [Pseudomonas sp. 148P]|uniref:Phage tail protein n=1 Tax=Pseudomonas ulcerans TaxID=3115852 RepID=A0ABU7HV80_9PSED|nr:MULTISPECIES: phage tail protein [unclassified Pseudomonas]MEE1924281.1 phage tail protein [Pseudomonas sp. 147P]MEE1935450.1 phage tail protein [Pseudomonas sp. 148P]
MAYMESMQSSLRSLAAAGEAGRRSADEMLGPLNGAVSDITGAATELENLPFVGEVIGKKLQRTMRAIEVAQSTVGMVAAKYNQAVSVIGEVESRLETFSEQAGKAATAINRIAGKISPSLGSILPTGAFAPQTTPAEEAVKPYPHLMILQPLQAAQGAFYFNLDTLAFNQLKRTKAYTWAAQERLSRSKAQQAVGLGDDKITLDGVVFPSFRAGLDQLQNLRSIAGQLKPLTLSTGYGEVLGNWCLTSITETQEALMAGGIPGRQTFTLELVSYGDDMPNV